MRRATMIRGASLGMVAAVGLAGCRGAGARSADEVLNSPEVVHHVVFFVLKDKSRAAELASDCVGLRAVPGVVAAWAGPPFDSGRSTVDKSYDVGFYIGFADAGVYAEYVDHPLHQALLKKWRPALEQIVVRDIRAEAR